MTTRFHLILLCLALLCLLPHLTPPAGLNHPLQIVSWGSGFDRGREPAPDVLTVAAVRSMEFRARAGPRQSLVLDCTLTARNIGPPAGRRMGHRHRLGPGELPASAQAGNPNQRPSSTLQREKARKYWLKPPILKNRGFTTPFS